MYDLWHAENPNRVMGLGKVVHFSVPCTISNEATRGFQLNTTDEVIVKMY